MDANPAVGLVSGEKNMEKITNFFKTFLLYELVKGMALTGRYFFARKITVQYPEEKTP